MVLLAGEFEPELPAAQLDRTCRGGELWGSLVNFVGLVSFVGRLDLRLGELEEGEVVFLDQGQEAHQRGRRLRSVHGRGGVCVAGGGPKCFELSLELRPFRGGLLHGRQGLLNLFRLFRKGELVVGVALAYSLQHVLELGGRLALGGSGHPAQHLADVGLHLSGPLEALCGNEQAAPDERLPLRDRVLNDLAQVGVESCLVEPPGLRAKGRWFQPHDSRRHP